MTSQKKPLIVILAAVLVSFAATGFSAEKAVTSPTAVKPMSAKKTHPIQAAQRQVAKSTLTTVAQPNMSGRNAVRWQAPSARLRGHTLEDLMNQHRGGIKPASTGQALMPEHVRRLKDKLAMERARFRDRELGMNTPLPEGVDPRRVPGRGCPNRSGEEGGLDTSYPPGDRAREEQIAAGKRQLREAGVIPPDGMDERITGLIEYEDGEYEWIEGDTRMGPDDENVTWGTLEPVDSDSNDGGEKETKDSAAVGDEDIMDEDAANVEKDPEPEGDDPDEILSPASRYRDVVINVDEAFRMQGAVQGDGRGRGSGGPQSDPSERQRREKLNDIWGATHIVPYAVAPVDPEDGGPDEAGSPIGEGVAAFTNGYAHQPAPGGDDPDDPRAGGNALPVSGRATFGGDQNGTLNSGTAGSAFSPAIGDDGGSAGPSGPEF